jgi:N-acetylneuraminate synthase
MTIEIGGRKIGPGHPPLIVAEMSGNHNQSLDRAMQIVEAAAASGAHALKLQTYTADTITLDAAGAEFRIGDAESLWSGRTLHELYRSAATPWEWHEPIFRRCRELGLLAFSSPFDETAVDFLDDLGVPAFKIASFENTHLPLIRKAASKGKPLIVSTGMATLQELDEAMQAARGVDVVLLKCTSTYPASPADSNLLTIPELRRVFACEAGLSDHTMGIGVAVASVALGASVIEKHFTLARADGGVDSAFSMEPAEMRLLVDESLKAWQALGTASFGPTEREKKSLQFRRSIYVARPMKAGDAFTAENLRVVRPANGLHPRYYDVLLGRRIARDADAGTPLTWDLLLPR